MLRTIIRQAHTGVAVTAAGKVDMLPGVSGTYAYSLFQVALKEKCLPEVVSRLDEISSIVKETPGVAAALHNPSLSSKQREKLVSTLNESVKQNNNVYVSNFLHTLAQNNRLSFIPQINTDLNKLFDQYRGVVSVTLTTAKPWNSESQKTKTGERLAQAIKNSSLLSKNQTIKLDYKVNPELLGGLLLEVGDKTIDLSVKSKVQDLNNLLKADL